MFEYQAKVRDVVDGDTLKLTVDKGFNDRKLLTLRVADVDTHEIHGVSYDSEEYEMGMMETAFVESWIPEEPEWPLIVKTQKKGKYGRWLGKVTRKSDGEELHKALFDRFDDITYD